MGVGVSFRAGVAVGVLVGEEVGINVAVGMTVFVACPVTIGPAVGVLIPVDPQLFDASTTQAIIIPIKSLC